MTGPGSTSHRRPRPHPHPTSWPPPGSSCARRAAGSWAAARSTTTPPPRCPWAECPDRFHCFGCGASGDVIDFVQRLHGLSFPEAVEHLAAGMPATAHRGRPPPACGRPGSPADRGGVPPSPGVRDQRPGLGARTPGRSRTRPRSATCATTAASTSPPSRSQLGQPAGRARRARLDHPDRRPARDGVTDRRAGRPRTSAQPTRRRTLIDTLRDRLIVPVLDAQRADPRVHRPRHQRRPPRPEVPQPHPHRHLRQGHDPVPAHAPRRDPGATVVIVEGASTPSPSPRPPLRPDAARVRPLAANGVAVTHAHAARAAHLTGGALLVAMDGDQAGREGTTRGCNRSPPARTAGAGHRAAQRQGPGRVAGEPRPRRAGPPRPGTRRPARRAAPARARDRPSRPVPQPP